RAVEAEVGIDRLHECLLSIVRVPVCILTIEETGDRQSRRWTGDQKAVWCTRKQPSVTWAVPLPVSSTPLNVPSQTSPTLVAVSVQLPRPVVMPAPGPPTRKRKYVLPASTVSLQV